MAPFYKNKIEWRIGTTCEATGVKDTMNLPCCLNNFLRWMLGACNAKEGNTNRCKHRPENMHPTAAYTPNDCALQLVEVLQPSVDKLLDELSTKQQCTQAMYTAPAASVPKKSEITWDMDNAVGDLGKIRPIWEINSLVVSKREHTFSSTYIVPLQDFSWTVAPPPKTNSYKLQLKLEVKRRRTKVSLGV